MYSCHGADFQCKVSYVGEHVEGARARSWRRRNRHQFSTQQRGAKRDKSGRGLTDRERCRHTAANVGPRSMAGPL